MTPETHVSPATAVISGATVAAGHDGRAEILVELTYPNGATTSVSVPAESCLVALDRAGISELGDLVGRPWHMMFSHLEGVLHA